MGDKFDLDVKSSIKNFVFVDVTNARPRFLYSFELIGCIAYLWLGHFTDTGGWQKFDEGRGSAEIWYSIK